MAKGERKAKSSTIISVVLALAFTIIVSLFTVNNYLKIDTFKESREKLNSELSTIKTEYNAAKADLDKTEDEIENIKNIDKKTEEVKVEVFDLAKNVEEKIQKGETKYKIAYITFDDGPYYLTNKVLEILKKKKVKATFFNIGAGKEQCYDKQSEDCTVNYKKVVDQGHTIANHTYSHAIFRGLYNSVDSFMAEVDKQEKLILEKTGVKMNILRFPGGSATAGYLKNGIIEKLRERGYGWVDWTAQDGDGGDLDSRSTAWANFTGSINENIEVVLFHDYSTITASLLEDAIDYLENKNYILLPLFYDSVKVNK